MVIRVCALSQKHIYPNIALYVAFLLSSFCAVACCHIETPEVGNRDAAVALVGGRGHALRSLEAHPDLERECANLLYASLFPYREILVIGKKEVQFG